MGILTDAKLELLHAHYVDTNAGIQQIRESRDRYFAWVLALLTVALYDVYAPQDFGRLLAGLLKSKGGLESAPDLRYLGTLLWFTLLGLVLRYYQAGVLLDRRYEYVHRLEAQLSGEFGGAAFTREGQAYLADYPVLSGWAHWLYTVAFPLLLTSVVLSRGAHDLRTTWPWPGLVWIDLGVVLALLLSGLFYVRATHGAPRTWAWLKRVRWKSEGATSVAPDGEAPPPRTSPPTRASTPSC